MPTRSRSAKACSFDPKSSKTSRPGDSSPFIAATSRNPTATIPRRGVICCRARDVFEKTVAWIEANRLECATFHILTPYAETPLFAELEAAGRIVHRDWRLYDTAHVVFEPARMTAEQLFAGYEWCYRRLFSHASIWRRRPRDWRAVLPYLAMSYLYKRSNLIWHLLIKYRLTALIWRPLIELSRRRHLRFRRRLEAREGADAPRTVVSAGV
jgi:hypothetical protein